MAVDAITDGDNGIHVVKIDFPVYVAVAPVELIGIAE